MAKVGNHGRIIPRDRDLLHRLYWVEQHSLPSLGRMFGVGHKAMENVFRELDIPRRKRRTKGQSRWMRCALCDRPVHKIKHAGNGSSYGKLCKRHWDEHRATLARQEREKPSVKAKIKKRYRRWYEQGPVNPQGEGQWISKSRALLRTAKRLLRAPIRAASPSRNAASRPDRTSQE